MSVDLVAPAPSSTRQPLGRGRAAMSVLGEILITAGVLVGLYSVYLLFGTGIATAAAQDDLQVQLEQAWSQKPPASDGEAEGDGEAAALTLGDATAIITSQAIDKDWQWIVQEGVTLDILADGPGHYPETQMPGTEGVVAIAAHRATHGEPFAHLDLLDVGETVQLEVRDAIYTYTVRKTAIVAPTDIWVLDPRPEITNGLTLTTCHPRWGSTSRLIVWAEETGVTPKAAS